MPILQLVSSCANILIAAWGWTNNNRVNYVYLYLSARAVFATYKKCCCREYQLPVHTPINTSVLLIASIPYPDVIFPYARWRTKRIRDSRNNF